jgi:uncharacterized protein (TIGR02284 family)
METTREEANKIQHHETVSSLQELLKINYDSREGFKQVMLKSKNPALTNYLKERAALHSAFATELSNVLVSLNETPAESGTTPGAIHRTWIDIKTTFTGNNAESILEECIRGEKSIVEDYETVLKDKIFAPDITDLLKNQLGYISSTLTEVKSLENLVD